jgi:ferric-dicitrate binding protein FerR (iron transport regulator)
LPELLATVEPNEERRRLEGHVRQCPACRELFVELGGVVAALREVEPPPVPEHVKRHETLKAIATYAERRSESRHSWARPLMAATAVAVMLIVGIAVFEWRTPAAEIVLVAGALQSEERGLHPGEAVAVGTIIETLSGEAQLQLADGSEIKATPRARFAVHQTGGWRISLERGALSLHATVQPRTRPLLVETAEAGIRVVGTRFTVDSQPGLTIVSVVEGTVEAVVRHNGESVRVLAGQTERIGPEGLLRAREVVAPAPASAPTVVTSLDNEPTAEVRVRAADVRERLRAGKIKAAREFLRRLRSEAGARGAEAAEVAILEAEVLLAERRYDESLAAYRQVDRRYPGTPQAEAALFAAVQLTLDHGKGKEAAVELLRRCLNRYPRGRFASDARRLLSALERQEVVR